MDAKGTRRVRQLDICGHHSCAEALCQSDVERVGHAQAKIKPADHAGGNGDVPGFSHGTAMTRGEHIQIGERSFGILVGNHLSAHQGTQRCCDFPKCKIADRDRCLRMAQVRLDTCRSVFLAEQRNKHAGVEQKAHLTVRVFAHRADEGNAIYGFGRDDPLRLQPVEICHQG